MTFSTLIPDVVYMREQEGAFFADRPDSELSSMYLNSAKGDLSDHLEQALSLDLDDATDAATLDEYIDNHSARMTRALSTLLIVYWFQNNVAGQGAAMNLEKLDMWKKNYKTIRAGFPALKTKSGASTGFNVPIVK